MALVNDYFSFDREFNEFMSTGGAGQMYNAVAFLVQEKSLSIHNAKAALKEKVISLEDEFKRAWKDWLEAPGERPVRVQKYLEYAALTAAGSSFWHAKAPRYKVEVPLANQAGVDLLLRSRSPHDPVTNVQKNGEPIGQTLDEAGSAASTVPVPVPGAAGLEYRSQPLREPFIYMASMPSKNVRGILIDALDVWLQVPEPRLQVMKDIIGMLHNASLMCGKVPSPEVRQSLIASPQARRYRGRLHA